MRPIPLMAVMETLFASPVLISGGIVGLAEIGDKTQLLAFILAARYRKPWPILAGILIATLVNHGLAAWLGTLAAGWLNPEILRWVLGIGFLAMAAWCLLPDKAEDGPTAVRQAGAFVATLMAFFLMEIGDKTQIATIALAARFHDIVLVTAGTTLGMMAVNAPAVLCGDGIARRLPLRVIHGIAAAIFAVLGALTLLGLDFGLL